MPQSRWKIIVVFLLSLTDLYLSSGINGFSLTPLKLIRYAEDTYSQSGLNYYGHKLNLPDGPHTAVFIHAITEYIVKDLHVDLPKRGLLVLEDILNELRDSGLMAAADRVYITLLGLVLFEEWYEEATALIARYRGSGDDDKVVLLIDDLDIPEGQVGYVYWEYPTLHAMQLYASLVHPRTALLYVHTKAVTKRRRTLQLLGDNGWRRFLTYGLIWNYRTCVQAVQHFNFSTCGPQLEVVLDSDRFPHYIGNMFFVSAEYYSGTKPLPPSEWLEDRYYAEKHLFDLPRSQPFDPRQHYCTVFISHLFYDCPTPKYLYDDPDLYTLRPAQPQCTYIRNPHHHHPVSGHNSTASTGSSSGTDSHDNNGSHSGGKSSTVTPIQCVAPAYNPVSMADAVGWYFVSTHDEDWVGDVHTDGWGHRPVIQWLVKTMRPRLSVDVSSDDGYTTCVLAKAVAEVESAQNDDEDHSNGANDDYYSYDYDTTADKPRQHRHHHQHGNQNQGDCANDTAAPLPAAPAPRVVRVSVSVRGPHAAKDTTEPLRLLLRKHGLLNTYAAVIHEVDISDAATTFAAFEAVITPPTKSDAVIDGTEATAHIEADVLDASTLSINDETPTTTSSNNTAAASTAAIPSSLWIHGSIDILHISGEITEADVRAYVRRWLPRIHPTRGILLLPGVLAVHDKVGVSRVFADADFWQLHWPTIDHNHQHNNKRSANNRGKRYRTNPPRALYYGFFRESFGLGIVTASNALYAALVSRYPMEFFQGVLHRPELFPLSTSSSIQFYVQSQSQSSQSQPVSVEDEPSTASASASAPAATEAESDIAQSAASTSSRGATSARPSGVAIPIVYAELIYEIADGSSRAAKVFISHSNYHQFLKEVRGTVLAALSHLAVTHVEEGEVVVVIPITEGDLVLMSEYLRRDVVRAAASIGGVSEQALDWMAAIAPQCTLQTFIYSAPSVGDGDAEDDDDDNSDDDGDGVHNRGSNDDFANDDGDSFAPGTIAGEGDIEGFDLGLSDGSTTAADDLVTVPMGAGVSRTYLYRSCLRQAKELTRLLLKMEDRGR